MDKDEKEETKKPNKFTMGVKDKPQGQTEATTQYKFYDPRMIGRQEYYVRDAAESKSKKSDSRMNQERSATRNAKYNKIREAEAEAEAERLQMEEYVFSFNNQDSKDSRPAKKDFEEEKKHDCVSKSKPIIAPRLNRNDRIDKFIEMFVTNDPSYYVFADYFDGLGIPDKERYLAGKVNRVPAEISSLDRERFLDLLIQFGSISPLISLLYHEQTYDDVLHQIWTDNIRVGDLLAQGKKEELFSILKFPHPEVKSRFEKNISRHTFTDSGKRILNFLTKINEIPIIGPILEISANIATETAANTNFSNLKIRGNSFNETLGQVLQSVNEFLPYVSKAYQDLRINQQEENEEEEKLPPDGQESTQTSANSILNSLNEICDELLEGPGPGEDNNEITDFISGLASWYQTVNTIMKAEEEWRKLNLLELEDKKVKLEQIKTKLDEIEQEMPDIIPDSESMSKIERILNDLKTIRNELDEIKNWVERKINAVQIIGKQIDSSLMSYGYKFATGAIDAFTSKEGLTMGKAIKMAANVFGATYSMAKKEKIQATLTELKKLRSSLELQTNRFNEIRRKLARIIQDTNRRINS